MSTGPQDPNARRDTIATIARRAGGIGFGQITVNRGGSRVALVDSDWTPLTWDEATDPDPIGDLFTWDEDGPITVARDALITATAYADFRNDHETEDATGELYFWHGENDDEGPWYYFVTTPIAIPANTSQSGMLTIAGFLPAGDSIKLVARPIGGTVLSKTSHLLVTGIEV